MVTMAFQTPIIGNVKLKSSNMFKTSKDINFVVSKATSNITRHFKINTVPFYHS